jgi:hypothetical protein
MNAQLPLGDAAETEKPARILVQNGGGEILDPFPPEVEATLAAIEAEESGRRRRRRAGTAVAVIEQPKPTPEPERNSESVSHNDPDFWSRSADVLFDTQPSTAVWINQSGGLVIRQEDLNDTEDDWVIITQPNLHQFIDRLCDLAGIGRVP